MHVIAVSVIAALFCTSAVVRADQTRAGQEEAPDVVPHVLEEVLVTGEQPGPGLWKVSKSVADTNHVLWIVGGHAPLPKKMSWRSREIEAILAESQRLVTWARVDTDFDAGFFATLRAAPLLFSADRNVDGKKLQDVLPADVYSQWLNLKAKYLGEDARAEELRPTFAWKRLRVAAFSQSGLSSEALVEPTVERLARKHKVKIVQPKAAVLEIKIEKPRALLKKFKTTQLADVDCFGPSIASLEPRIETLKARANAWATGDIERLRSMSIAPSSDCEVLFNQAIFNGELANQMGADESLEKAREQSKRAETEAIEAWFTAVEAAVAAHPSTVAVVPIDNLMRANGVLEGLRLRGYVVTEP